MLSSKICKRCFMAERYRAMPFAISTVFYIAKGKWVCPARTLGANYNTPLDKYSDPPKKCLKRFEQAVFAGGRHAKS